jgi:NAD-dependent SIR2 family protein deacetylase
MKQVVCSRCLKLRWRKVNRNTDPRELPPCKRCQKKFGVKQPAPVRIPKKYGRELAEVVIKVHKKGGKKNKKEGRDAPRYH